MSVDSNRFARHPLATIAIVMVTAVLVILVAVEIFLSTFSGLGSPLLYEMSPLYGYRPKPNQTVEPRGGMGFLYAARVTTNNLGLRAAETWSESRSGKILFLGDSVTYGGQYVADGQLFSSVAGRALPGWQVGNGGVNAWGVENIVGLVLDYGFSPAEVVVTCVIEGDFYRGTTRAGSVPLWTEQPRFALQDLLMHLVWRANEARYGSSVDMVVAEEEHQHKIVDRAAKRLKELDDHLRRSNIDHFVFILPTRSQAVDDAVIDRRVQQALARYGIDAEYLLSAVRSREPVAERRREWFHDIVHLEPAGHVAYGESIGERLADRLNKR